MSNENALAELNEYSKLEIDDSFDLEQLESQLEEQLEAELNNLEFLKEERELIGNPDNLGEVIKDVVWEQFLNQIAVTAGDDFIKENRGLHLDLSKEAHIQTTENFADGKIATHNTKIDYQERYDNWQSNFQKDADGNIITHNTRSGKEEATLTREARKAFDKDRPKGSTERHTAMDHTISAAEIIRDPAANAHMTKDEQIAFSNSDVNLNEMNASWNSSKGDKTMTEWLDSPNANGQKPDEIFDISKEDEQQLRNKDKVAREELEKRKKEGENKSIEAGKQSRKEEAFRIGGKALRAVLMQLLAELVREVISKLIKWFKSKKRELNNLISYLKEAIHSFLAKMKTHLINAGNTLLTTIATAILGPIVGTIKKAWMLLKQSWQCLNSAIKYIKDPKNKGKPLGRLLLETGKLVIAGLTGSGALILGEVIEKSLMTIPVFAIEIPLLGSLANILGIFLGAVVAGIIGAIAINLIEKKIQKNQKEKNTEEQIDKGNEILILQHKVQVANEIILEQTITKSTDNIREHHRIAAQIMQNSLNDIAVNFHDDETIEETFNSIDDLLKNLENGL